MRVGYLHLGPREHGVTRYGRLLADGAARQTGWTVRQETLELESHPARDRDRLVAAARRLGDVEVVHVQWSTYNDLLWGRGDASVRNLQVFFDACPARVVVTIHDVWLVPRGVRGVRHGARRWWRDSYGHVGASLRVLMQRASAVIVSSRTEAARLAGRVDADRLVVIPLLVEPAGPAADAADTRRELGVDGARVLTSLGFVFPHKGNDLVIAALATLPEDVCLVLAGRDDVDPAHTAALHALAARLGVQHRVRFTGRLDDDALDRWLRATDLAVCAFRDLSASSSLSTWISRTRPVLATDLPQIREYDEFVPGAITRFHPYTAEALAAAALRCLEADEGPVHAKLVELRDHLSVERIVGQHAAVYRRA